MNKKRKIVVVSAISLMSLMAAGGGALSANARSPESMPGKNSSDQDVTKVQIEKLLSQIQKALQIVQNATVADASIKLPELESVTLNLSAELIKGAGATVDLYIVSFGAELSKETTQSITLQLEPPKPVRSTKRAEEIAEPLAKAILSAARGAASAEPMLKLAELKASIKFVVDAKGHGGLKFALLPITGEMKGQVSQATTQEIIVSFKVKDKIK
jgi:hypothetical protein